MSRDKPRFAVLTPVYNGGPFLAACMEAVQAQTYRPLIHVVLDNASTDATAEIIAQYQGRDVPVVTKRNAELLPAAANWSEAVRFVPSDVDYFKILCADDSMQPDAIRKLAEVAVSADDIRVLGAPDRWNGGLRIPNLPTSTDVFEAANFTARLFSDNADVPFHHLAYRIDTRTSAPFFPTGPVAFDAEGAFQALTQGGRVGWVHEPLFDTLDHAASLTSTWTNKVSPYHWEHLTRIERFAPGVLSESEFRRVLHNHLMRVYRRLMVRSVNGKGDIVKRDLQLLRARGYAPSLWDYIRSALGWPLHFYKRKVEWGAPFPPWPSTAFKLGRGGARQPNALEGIAAPRGADAG